MKFSPSTNGFYLEAIHGAGIPSDAVDITNEEYSALLAGQSQGKIITADQTGKPFLADPQLSQEDVIAQYEAALDDHLNNVAGLYRYDDRKSFALRAAYPGPYHAEGVAFGTWMDTCNAQAYRLLGDVLAGNAALPSIDEMISSLPIFKLPE